MRANHMGTHKQKYKETSRKGKELHQVIHIGDFVTSVLAEHAHSTGLPIYWTTVHVINTCTHTSRRCLLESWMIQKKPSKLNRVLGTLNFSCVQASHSLLKTCMHGLNFLSCP